MILRPLLALALIVTTARVTPRYCAAQDVPYAALRARLPQDGRVLESPPPPLSDRAPR